jgi:hypothetical protein
MGFTPKDQAMSYNNTVFWSPLELQTSGQNATILAVGDSWFWYPMKGGSLINNIGDLVVGKHKILAAGNNGAEAYDYVKGKYKGACKELFRLYGSSAEALLISGGGNDFAGFNDLRPMLNANCENATSPDQCFRPGTNDDEGCLNWLMNRTYENYALLISRAIERMKPTTKIFVHNYDYAVPTGKGLMGGDAWIKPALTDAKVPLDQQQACMRFLVDGHTSVLDKLKKALPDRIVVVDSRNTLAPTDWANELHPTGGGFKKIVKQRWQPLLEQHGIA